MKNLKITHVLNVTDALPNIFEDAWDMHINYLRVNIEDLNHVNIKLGFPMAYNFIDTALTTGVQCY